MNISETDKADINRIHEKLTSTPTFWFLASLKWFAMAAITFIPYPAPPTEYGIAFAWVCFGIGLARLGRWSTCLTEQEKAP
jgi:hypothetical protein